MGKADSAERSVTESLPRSRLPIKAEKESRLWIDERMTKAIENDPSDIALGVETRGPEHIGHLLANLPLIFRKWCGENFSPSQLPLRPRRQPRLGEVHEKG